MKRKIKIVITDVDGTLTDGKFTVDSFGNETKTFNVKDGMAIKILKNNNIKIAIITGHKSKIVKNRFESLNVDYYFENNNKIDVVKEILKKENIGFCNLAYFGDDLNDLELFNEKCFKGCPLDAAEEIKEKSDYVCSLKGGEGAFREFVEYLLSED